MSERRGAAVTYVALGAFALYRAVKNAVAFDEGFSFGQPFSPVLVRWGDTLGGLIAAAVLLGLAVVTLRARDRAEQSSALQFVNEASVPLAPLMGGFVLLIALMSFIGVFRYAGERGLAEKSVLLLPLLVTGFYFGAWVLLHHRRLALFDASAKVLEVSYGKPWALWTRRLPFGDFEAVAIDEVERARGKHYRVMATGRGGRQLVTFTFTRDLADQIAANVRSATGWR